MKSLVKKLVETTAPSGYETPLRNVVREEVQSLADGISVDALGNLIARKNPTSGQGMKIMLSAHMDEIGVIATHVDNNGFVRFTTVGGVRPHTCLGGRVRFLNGVGGVIGSDRLEDAAKVPTFEQLFIDVGASSRSDCPVKVGDIAGFERPFTEMGSRMVAKSMDDRIGVVVLIETMRQLQATPHEIYFVFSTQEEVGLRGATTAAYGVDPDLGISVDVTGTGDTPRGSKMEVKLGAGPAIKVRDGGMLSDPRVVSWMVNGAKKARLPYQLEVLEGGTTDARAMQITRSGMPAGCVSIPCRYIHSPSEMVDLNDVQNAINLLVSLLSAPINLG